MSAYSCRSWMDILYLGILIPQLIGMFVCDFLPLYSTSLVEGPLAPVAQFRHFYGSYVGDPYVKGTPEPWFEAVTFVELFTQFPLAVYLICKLLAKRPADGPAELAGLAFACLNFMGSVLATYDIWHMSPKTFEDGQQMKLVFTIFGPYAVISLVMAVDNYTRLLKRIQEPAKAKSH